MGKSINEQTYFPLLFSFILMLHLGLLALHFKIPSPAKNIANAENKTRPMKVRVIPLDLSRQIVQSSDTQNRKVSENAYLSDKTRTFDRQTRARVNDIFKVGQKGGGGGTPKASRKSLKLSDLGTMVGKDPFAEAAKTLTKGKGGRGKGNRSVSSSSTNDFLPNVPLGDMTELNTVEYKFYGFYHRIRQKLEQFWGRSLEDKAKELLKQGRRVASEEMITSLQITLDSQGEIVAIKVLGTSGIKELDDAAIESFNDAGPFPNPPRDLIVDGKVTIEWGFVVKS